jgi:drug/metabolite transporter (DMT)-like permease
VTTSHGERVAFTAFVTYTVLAGGNAVGIRFSNRELAPLWGAGLRFALAAALFLTVMLVLRLRFPRGRALVGSLLYGLLNFAGSFGLIYYGLVHVHAGLGQILLALVPLATGIGLPHRPETWAAMAYLVVIGSVVVFLPYLIVLRYWAASRASDGFVIIPFITLVLSAWLDNEPVGLGLALGGLLVLAGVYVGALRPARLTPAAVTAKD